MKSSGTFCERGVIEVRSTREVPPVSIISSIPLPLNEVESSPASKRAAVKKPASIGRVDVNAMCFPSGDHAAEITS